MELSGIQIITIGIHITLLLHGKPIAQFTMDTEIPEELEDLQSFFKDYAFAPLPSLRGKYTLLTKEALSQLFSAMRNYVKDMEEGEVEETSQSRAVCECYKWLDKEFWEELDNEYPPFLVPRKGLKLYYEEIWL